LKREFTAFVLGSAVATLTLSGNAAMRTSGATYVETPEGIAPAKLEAGASSTSIAWLQHFRGPLLSKVGANPRDELHDAILSDWKRLLPLMNETFPTLSQRQQFIAFIALRVSGSFSTYVVRPRVPNSLHALLTSYRGNCSDYSIRLAMALDSVGVQTAIIPINTPSLPGHVVIDAFDREDGSGYLLDSLFNTILRYDNAGMSFINKWIQLAPEQRAAYFDAEDSNQRLFNPAFFRFLDGGTSGLTGTPITLDSINSITVEKRQVLWRAAMTGEWREYLGWWKNSYPNMPPRNLADFGSAFDIKGINDFRSQYGVETRPMWEAAGLSVYDPGVFKFENNPRHHSG
jgi:hypothetical protein